MCMERSFKVLDTVCLGNTRPAALIFDALPLTCWIVMKGTMRHASSSCFFSSFLMCSGFCWLGATQPSHQTAARLALRGLTLIEWPNYPIVLSMKRHAAAAAAGTETCNEMGHRLETCTPSMRTADQSRGSITVNLTFKEIPVWVM